MVTFKRVGWADTRQKAMQARVTERKALLNRYSVTRLLLFVLRHIQIIQLMSYQSKCSCLPLKTCCESHSWLILQVRAVLSIMSVRCARSSRCRSDRALLKNNTNRSEQLLHQLRIPSYLSLSLSLSHTHTQRCSTRQWIILMSRIFPMNQLSQFTKPIWTFS